MTGNIRIPQLRHWLALTEGISCTGHSSNSQDGNDRIRDPSADSRLSLLEYSEQEKANGHLTGCQTE